MQNLVEEYSEITAQIKQLTKRKGEISKELLAAYNARPETDPERKKLKGTSHCITVVHVVSKTFDKAKWIAKHGDFHKAYYRETVSTQLRIGGLE